MVFPDAEAPMPITKISRMRSLLNCNAVNFFFDIEETILADNVWYSALEQSFYSRLLFSLTGGSNNLRKIISLGKNFHRHLLDPETPEILKLLEKSNKRIFALTSGFLSPPKIKKLFHLNVHFEYIIFTKKMAKGPILVNFLKRYDIKGKCAFIDNDLNKLENVYENYFKNYNTIIDLYWFQRKPDIQLTQQGFINYWTKVIEAYKKSCL